MTTTANGDGRDSDHGGVDVERCISNNMDSAVAALPFEQGTMQGTRHNSDDKQVENSSDTTMQAEHSAPPDGGLQAWLVVAGAWCCSFCSYGWINVVGIFQQYYAQGPLRDYSNSQISWIPALQIFLMYFLGPPIGLFFDRYGPEKLLIAGSLMHVFGLMMASISTKYYQFLLSQGVCSSIGAAAVFMSAIACVSGWFDRRRGLAFGVLASGSSMGGVVLPIMITRILDSTGYGWAMRAGAFVIAALLVVAVATVRRRAAIAPQTSFTRAQMGEPLREPAFVLMLLGLFLIPFGLYTPINYLPTVATRTGMARSLAQSLVAVYNGASLVGRVGSGILADRFGRYNTFIMSCYGAGVLILAVWIPSTGNASTFVFAALFGLFSGAYVALLLAVVAQVSPIREIGYRNGVANLAQSFGGLAATPIAGAILDGQQGLLGIKMYAGMFLIAGTTSVLIARLCLTKFRLKVIM